MDKDFKVHHTALEGEAQAILRTRSYRVIHMGAMPPTVLQHDDFKISHTSCNPIIIASLLLSSLTVRVIA